MSTITINPGWDSYRLADFKVSVIRKTSEDTITTNEIALTSRNRVTVKLFENDVIGVTYKGVVQMFSPKDNTTGIDNPSQTTYTVAASDFGDDGEAHLSFNVQGSAEDYKDKNRVIDNDVNVNIKSAIVPQPFEVRLTPSTGVPTKDQAFWEVINSHHLDFEHYRNFIDDVLTSFPPSKPRGSNSPASDSKLYKSLHPSTAAIYKKEGVKKDDSRRLPFNRAEAYSLLKFATERYVERVFSLKHFLRNDDGSEDGFELEDYLGKDKVIPYYDLVKSKIKEYFNRDHCAQSGFLKSHDDITLVELIWNYWYEEGMVGKTMDVIAKRFQNIKNGFKDPLSNFALDPLRPLNNILWGYIQDTQHRLSLTRLNYEFTSEYDLCVVHGMKPGFDPAERRSKFLQSFHRLIYEATEYFVQSDNTTIRPDGFRLLNALSDTHRILAEGSGNQFGDLPTVARIEMLIEQWILSRPEIREFLGSRVMVPYEEPWMDRVDSMKALQGWNSAPINVYRDLAVYGEKILLGIRYGNWSVLTSRDHATNWADAFRDTIQRYVHSYYTVTGVDLSAQNVSINSQEKYLLPGILIREKFMRERPAVRRY